jgi:hypothetical protein
MAVVLEDHLKLSAIDPAGGVDLFDRQGRAVTPG